MSELKSSAELFEELKVQLSKYFYKIEYDLLEYGQSIIVFESDPNMMLSSTLAQICREKDYLVKKEAKEGTYKTRITVTFKRDKILDDKVD